MGGNSAILLFAAMQAASPLGPSKAPSVDDAVIPQNLSNTCVDALGPIGSAPGNLQKFDGSKMKKPKDVEKARKSVKSGAPILINGGNFAGADFRKSQVTNVCFMGANLAATRWEKASANGVAFVGSNLTGASLSGAIMSRVLFRDSDLTNAQAVRADLSGGRIDGGWTGKLTNVVLDSAQMSSFSFDCYAGEERGCPFDRKGISARGTDLTGAKLSSFSFWDLNLQGAKLDRTEIHIDALRLLNGAQLAGPVVVRGNTQAVTIQPADMGAILAALPTPNAAPALPDCEIETPKSIDDMVCANRRGPIAMAVRDIANFESMDASIAVNGARIYNDQLNACFTVGVSSPAMCAENAARDRREKLAAAAGLRSWLKAGEKAVFAKIDTDTATAYTSKSALGRLTPALAGSAPAYVLVQLDSRGVASIRGSALTENGSYCSINAGNVRRQSGNGWLSAASGTDTAGKRAPATPIIRIWKGSAEIHSALAGPASGMSAADGRAAGVSNCSGASEFGGTLLRIPVSDTDFDRMWTTLGG